MERRLIPLAPTAAHGESLPVLAPERTGHARDAERASQSVALSDAGGSTCHELGTSAL